MSGAWEPSNAKPFWPSSPEPGSPAPDRAAVTTSGRPLVVTGVAGGGKSTIIGALLARHPEAVLSVSATTRAPRPGEVDGVDYHFVSEAEFDRMIAAGDLVEWVEIYGYRSGTPRAAVEEILLGGRDVLFDLDVRGTRFIQGAFPDAVAIFLRPPDLSTQRARLAGRGTQPEDMARRLAEAEAQIGVSGEFDAVVVNDVLETAVAEADAILFGSPRSTAGNPPADPDADLNATAPGEEPQAP